MSTDFLRPAPALHELDPGQMERLWGLLGLLVLEDPERPGADENIVCGWHLVRDDPALCGWLAERWFEVGGELQRQEELLRAAELDLAGGHIEWVDDGDIDAGAGWDAFCECGWEAHGLPDEAAALEAAEEHDRTARQEAP